MKHRAIIVAAWACRQWGTRQIQGTWADVSWFYFQLSRILSTTSLRLIPGLLALSFATGKKEIKLLLVVLRLKLRKTEIMGCFSLSSNLIGKHFFVTATEKNEGTMITCKLKLLKIVLWSLSFCLNIKYFSLACNLHCGVPSQCKTSRTMVNIISTWSRL